MRTFGSRNPGPFVYEQPADPSPLRRGIDEDGAQHRPTLTGWGLTSVAPRSNQPQN